MGRQEHAESFPVSLSEIKIELCRGVQETLRTFAEFHEEASVSR